MAKRAKAAKTIGPGIEIEGLDELLKQLGGLQKLNLTPALDAAATPVHASIQGETPVDTGSLRNAIVKTVGKRRAVVRYDKSLEGSTRSGKRVASNKAALVEFGSRKHAPNPFFSRGFLKAKATAEAALTKGIQDAIDKAL